MKGIRPFFLSFFSFFFFWYQKFNKKLITTWYATHFEEFLTVFTSLYQKTKKLFYILSCIKQNVCTFLFYFLRLFCIYSSHSLRHPSLGFTNSSLTLRQRSQPLLLWRYPFFRALHFGIQFSLRPVASLFGTQKQPTQSPVKSSNFPLWKNHGFLGSLFC